jgi:hypothetical protein
MGERMDTGPYALQRQWRQQYQDHNILTEDCFIRTVKHLDNANILGKWKELHNTGLRELYSYIIIITKLSSSGNMFLILNGRITLSFKLMWMTSLLLYLKILLMPLITILNKFSTHPIRLLLHLILSRHTFYLRRLSLPLKSIWL